MQRNAGIFLSSEYIILGNPTRSDASTKAIELSAYLKTVQQDGQTEVGFVMGNSRPPGRTYHPTIGTVRGCPSC
ncbi:hypothetical protein KUCAC02_008580 [Chaenocephalus aceratus]|uniref:Uncharacterized protein n=1 Tax=Chaenocephalus aceratus TaxID=36190 RepID=A0ACB9WRQ4_CHAAC|nr:hypothetical protein KUCAC02_008580 [Chaenocephalus aceratus]